MTNYNRPVRILLVLLIGFFIGNCGLMAQDTGFTLNGKILQSGSGLPLQQAVISVSATGESAISGEDGTFTLEMPASNMKILVNFPGYHTTELYTKAQNDISVYLTPLEFKSDDENISSPLGPVKLKNTTNSVSLVTKSKLHGSATSSFEQTLIGQVPGLQMVEHSGMPGHNTWMNIRGISSIFCRNQPLVFVDGLIHEINFPSNMRIQGHMQNPMDIVDIDDIVDITVAKMGEGMLGGAGSNGTLYINTEQKTETSASILIKMYGGIALPPDNYNVLDNQQFSTYFNSLLATEGYSGAEIDGMYPWLNSKTGEEIYRYNSATNWQSELLKPAAIQKYYIFLKGGDDIATYNISSGFQLHGAPYDDWRSSRYNLRLSGKINITNKLSITPNTKLSLSDSYLSNTGPNSYINPVISSLLKSPLMAPNERSTVDGSVLFPYDDVGAFNISNPAVLSTEGMGSARNFQLLSSVKIDYIFSPKLVLSNTIGTSVSNDRVNLFIPDVGVVQLDSAKNSPQDMTTEFRSTQNHTTLTYKTTLDSDHNLELAGGLRYMANVYKNSQSIDLNTPSDDFRSLGQGGTYTYLRTAEGFSNELKWVSYFADASYAFRDKYYLRTSLSYDGSSVFNAQNRYNFYPSVFGAWRISSEEFFNADKINDLKLRASYSITGNMYSSIYEFSKNTYTGRRYNNRSVVVRDYNPNPDMEAEKKATINAGLDIALAGKSVNLHVDYYMASVNNLVINQRLPYNFGFTDYFNNDGEVSLSGIEVGADARIYLGQSILFLGATMTQQTTEVKSLEFINPNTDFLVREVFGAEYISSVGNPMNAFYGYKVVESDPVYDSDADANGIVGPNGRRMGAGDVAYEDVDENGVINELDKQIIGNPNPDIFGSLSAGLRIKRFEVSALFTYSYGNDVYNYVKYKTTSMDSYANQSTDVLDRWTADNTGADIPRASIGDPTGNTVFSDRWIEDGSFVRLKQFKVSYKAQNLFGLQKEATIYLTGTNLFTFTNYSGYDPETMYVNDPYFMGIDYGKIPLLRSVIFGIQLSL